MFYSSHGCLINFFILLFFLFRNENSKSDSESELPESSEKRKSPSNTGTSSVEDSVTDDSERDSFNANMRCRHGLSWQF